MFTLTTLHTEYTDDYDSYVKQLSLNNITTLAMLLKVSYYIVDLFLCFKKLKISINEIAHIFPSLIDDI